jgi:hypothetical protein
LGLLLLGVLGEDSFVLLNSLAGVLVTVNGLLLNHVLASDTGLGDEALDLGGLVESLVGTLDFASNNVLADIILLLVKTEALNDIVSALLTETAGSMVVSNTFELVITLLDDAEENSSKVGAENAAADGLSLALTNTAGFVTSSTYCKNG